MAIWEVFATTSISKSSRREVISWPRGDADAVGGIQSVDRSGLIQLANPLIADEPFQGDVEDSRIMGSDNSLHSFQRMQERIGLPVEFAQAICCRISIYDTERILERQHDLGSALLGQTKTERLYECCCQILDDVGMV